MAAAHPTLQQHIDSPADQHLLGNIIYEKVCISTGNLEYHILDDVMSLFRSLNYILKNLANNNYWSGGQVFDMILVGPNGLYLPQPQLAQSVMNLYQDANCYFNFISMILHRNKNPNINFSPRTALFFNLANLSQLNCDDFIYFCYHNPLIWNDEDDMIFLYKVFELRKRNRRYFDARLNITRAVASMVGWHSRFLNLSVVLQRVLTHNAANYAAFQQDNMLVHFIRNCFSHFQDSQGYNYMTTQEFMTLEFNQFLGDAVPGVYFAILLGDIYSQCALRFGISLSDFYRLDPLPLR